MALLTNVKGIWEFESSLLADSIGANTLTNNNTVTTVAGIVGSNAAHFAKASSQYLSIANNASLQSDNGDISVAFWVYMDTKTTAQTYVVKGGTLYEFSFYYDMPVDQFNFQIVCTDGTSFPSVHWTTFSPALATWYWLLGQWDSVNHQLAITANNGTPVTSSPGNTLIIRSTAEQFRIGADASGVDPADGRMDQVVFAKKIFTAADRANMYNGGNGMSAAQMAVLDASDVGYVTNYHR